MIEEFYLNTDFQIWMFCSCGSLLRLKGKLIGFYTKAICSSNPQNKKNSCPFFLKVSEQE